MKKWKMTKWKWIVLILFLFFLFLCLVNQKVFEGFDLNSVDVLPLQISVDNTTISVPNIIQGYSGSDLNFGGGLQLNNDNTFEFGKGIAKELNAGKIGYQTWTGDSLDIVGAGEVAGQRKVHMFDIVDVGNSLDVATDVTVSSLNTQTANTNQATVQSAGIGDLTIGQNLTINGNLQVNGQLGVNGWTIQQGWDNIGLSNSLLFKNNNNSQFVSMNNNDIDLDPSILEGTVVTNLSELANPNSSPF